MTTVARHNSPTGAKAHLGALKLKRRTLHASEVAAVMGIGVQTVYDMAAAGRLPGIRVGGAGTSWRFPLARLAAQFPDIFARDDRAA